MTPAGTDSKSEKTAGKKGARPRPRGSRSGEATAALQAALAVEAHHLRMLLREVAHHLVNNLESQAVHLIEQAAEIPAGPKKRAALGEIIATLHALEVRPEKGRLGDLRAIRDLVRETNKRLEQLL